MTCRRRLELVLLRGGAAAPEAEGLKARVGELTEELIARYSADLSLVDTVLLPPYPQGVPTSPRQSP